MDAPEPILRLTVTCDRCGSENELNLTDVPPDQPVTCSNCGERLGTVEELGDQAADPTSRDRAPIRQAVRAGFLP
jgi:transcription elongation factor Elf1